jgi:hypothetical protein
LRYTPNDAALTSADVRVVPHISVELPHVSFVYDVVSVMSVSFDDGPVPTELVIFINLESDSASRPAPVVAVDLRDLTVTSTPFIIAPVGIADGKVNVTLAVTDIPDIVETRVDPWLFDVLIYVGLVHPVVSDNAQDVDVIDGIIKPADFSYKSSSYHQKRN